MKTLIDKLYLQLQSCPADGQEKGLKVMSAVFENRNDFVCTDHCSGSNMNQSPADIVNHISRLSE